MFYIDYEIKYAVLDSKLISNQCGPRGEDAKRSFYKDLEKDVLENGFRNPILVIAGQCLSRSFKDLPKEMQDDSSKILWCGGNGGSRLWVAQRHKLVIPCIISDHVNMFPDAKVLNSIDEIKACYKDQIDIAVTKRNVGVKIF